MNQQGDGDVEDEEDIENEQEEEELLEDDEAQEEEGMMDEAVIMLNDEDLLVRVFFMIYNFFWKRGKCTTGLDNRKSNFEYKELFLKVKPAIQNPHNFHFLLSCLSLLCS